MHDIKTIALNLEVTVQTVYNHLKKHNKELKPHIFKSKGITYLDDEGLLIVKKSLGLIEVPTIQKDDVNIEDIVASISMQVSNSIKNDLLNDLSTLILQREVQMKEQYEKKLEEFKLEIIEKQQEQIQAENKKLMDYIAITREDEKKGFFSRLFK